MNNAIDKYVKRICEYLHEYPNDISMACINIISKIYEHDVNNIYHLSFGRLYEWSGIENHEKFNIALYILVDSRINILEQHFEAFNEIKNRFEGVDDDFIHEVLTTKDYVHPFTFETISEVEFNKLINIFLLLLKNFGRI
ncbi:hypothetical protein ACINNAV18_3402 [Acinetobacter baumannii Naval-18]|uniref:hypothetical protein n=1 Tax=Acinetobacter baumannii TaxID=470 RepID=UPI00027891D5|nr:hypothetical protein [Acinetobacter baumannii]EJP49700.1 hypothetical protein ACINNAV18_3402 [Acinetobacter baumannii Naval-18]